VVCQHPFEMPPTWGTLTDPFEGQAVKNSPSLEILTTRPRLLGGIILVVCGLSFIGWKIGAPIIARVSNNRWVEYYEQGDLDRARETLKQAIQLNPNNRAAHFTLGWLCEQTRNFQCAREKYQIAMELGLPAAYSNQARLYIILDRDYDAAVDLLLEGIRLVEQKPVRYSFLKNLGWARLKQERYPEASKFLQDAIELYSDRAPAYCLYAQVFEARNDVEQAIARWENCLDYARPEDRDEDRWIGMARQRLPSLRRKSIEAENASSRFPRNPQDR
jgi:tetratricopeptide (TPR) repeat protein